MLNFKCSESKVSSDTNGKEPSPALSSHKRALNLQRANLSSCHSCWRTFTSSVSAWMLSEYWDGAIGLSVSAVWGNTRKWTHPELFSAPLEMTLHHPSLQLLAGKCQGPAFAMSAVKVREERVKKKGSTSFLSMHEAAGFLSWWSNPTLHPHG